MQKKGNSIFTPTISQSWHLECLHLPSVHTCRDKDTFETYSGVKKNTPALFSELKIFRQQKCHCSCCFYAHKLLPTGIISLKQKIYIGQVLSHTVTYTMLFEHKYCQGLLCSGKVFPRMSVYKTNTFALLPFLTSILNRIEKLCVFKQLAFLLLLLNLLYALQLCETFKNMIFSLYSLYIVSLLTRRERGDGNFRFSLFVHLIYGFGRALQIKNSMPHQNI